MNFCQVKCYYKYVVSQKKCYFFTRFSEVEFIIIRAFTVFVKSVIDRMSKY